jgi:2-desacetyl-2-hydroxyethyl bacteriochlorophyllide A dehydrogenase
MATLMRRALLQAPNDLVIEEVSIPELSAGDVLLRVDAALLCGTDVRIFNGTKTKNVSLPSVLGHEFAGTVVDVNGQLPDGLNTGDQVCVYPLLPCGECAACRRGHENICQHREAFGYQHPGGLSEFIRVPARAVKNLVPLPGVPAREAAIVEPMACALNGQQLARIGASEALLVSGCGPLGQMHIRLARAMGVKRIAAVDPVAERRDLAVTSGADLVLAPGEDTVAELKDWSDGGLDALIMAVGRTDALEPYLPILGPGARVSVFAGFASADKIAVTANDIHYNEWTFVGASSCRLDGFHTVADLISSGKVVVSDLLGSVLPLEKTEEAIGLVQAAADMRVGVDPHA